MSDEIRVNRPQPQQSMRGESVNMPMGSAYSPAELPAPKRSKLPWLVLAGVVVVLGVLGFLFREKLFPKTASDKGNVAGAETDKASGYEAVFLTNGQVYFGKLTHADDQYATLKDVYYLQVNQPPLQQGSQSTTQQQQQQPQQQPQISLVKLGNELHGPLDEMKINRDQILFFESLKEGGQVMKAIYEYQKNPTGAKNAPAPGQQPPATTTEAPKK